MKKIDVGQAISILANIGVFVGVLLLVFELAQNRQMMRSQIRNDLNSGLMNYQALVSEAEIADIFQRADTAGDLGDLTDTERFQYRAMRGMQLRYFENLHYQYRNGLFDEEEFLAQRDFWRRIYDRGAPVEYWCSVRSTYSPEFRVELDSLLGQKCE